MVIIRGVTHLSAGLFLGALTGISFGNGAANILTCSALGGVAAVLPDIDHPGSMSGRVLRPVSMYLEERWGHRDSPTHTAAFAFLAALPIFVVCVVFKNIIGVNVLAAWLATFIGGLSHLVMDSVTRSGLRPWRYLPIVEKWRLKIYRGKLESGKSPLEWGLALVGFLGTLVLSLITLKK